jgi:hypothetical protein
MKYGRYMYQRLRSGTSYLNPRTNSLFKISNLRYDFSVAATNSASYKLIEQGMKEYRCRLLAPDVLCVVDLLLTWDLSLFDEVATVHGIRGKMLGIRNMGKEKQVVVGILHVGRWLSGKIKGMIIVL